MDSLPASVARAVPTAFDFPELSDKCWNEALASSEAAYAARRNDGFFVVAALQARLIAKFAGQKRLSEADAEDVQEDALIEPVVALLMRKAGVYRPHSADHTLERNVQRAFFVFVDMVVAERGFPKAQLWFDALFSPIVAAMVDDVIEERLRAAAVQSGSKRCAASPVSGECKRRRIEADSTSAKRPVPPLSTFDILLRLRQRQSFRHLANHNAILARVPTPPPCSVITPSPILPSHSSIFAPSLPSSTTPTVPVAQAPDLEPSMPSGPASAPADQAKNQADPIISPELLDEAERLIKETIAETRRQLQFASRMVDASPPTKHGPEVASRGTKDSENSDKQLNTSEGIRRLRKANSESMPLSSSGMANSVNVPERANLNELKATSSTAFEPPLMRDTTTVAADASPIQPNTVPLTSSYCDNSFTAPLVYDTVPERWFWPNVPTDMFSNTFLSTVPPVFYFT
ncbi:hypothetical protein HMN09_00408000 [Mycena chlorophos]|uniref:Uncharacterized protein n=1 Tax=Mycena chlorophos TaxID=658473 RepID=A0A8H6WLF7_MYCCL|nr:hypothetical protein HMN09_00408000 [Mycena chlorophos]